MAYTPPTVRKTAVVASLSTLGYSVIRLLVDWWWEYRYIYRTILSSS